LLQRKLFFWDAPVEGSLNKCGNRHIIVVDIRALHHPLDVLGLPFAKALEILLNLILADRRSELLAFGC